MKEFLDSGVNPSQASLYADAISYPGLMAAAFPIAKITGDIRSKKSKFAPERFSFVVRKPRRKFFASFLFSDSFGAKFSYSVIVCRIFPDRC
jgi:hypothetical protein